ncbi:putative F-box/FBD/LRR-repeat protein-like [Capsicum annuum]|nr:putative F-box/FBD/LRR-repeat protein-like [Capsicum annuum]KAF3672889.1 putative F-box/FBD/LRR-repeat protein-like [Capsicum annuum]
MERLDVCSQFDFGASLVFYAFGFWSNIGFSHSYSTNRDKNLSDVSSDYRSNGRIEESGARLSNQGAVTHLLEQISTLNDRMDDFTSKMEELNSKWSSRRASPRIKQASPSTQNLALETEACIGSAPTNYFISGLENGSLTGSIMPNSSSFTSVNGKEFTLMEEISNIARGQRQVMHQLDNVSNVLRERLGEESRQERMNKKRDTMDPIRVPLIVALAVGGLGILLFKSLQHQT